MLVKTMNSGCEETFELAPGNLYCDLSAGHAGPHKDRGMEQAIWWQKELTRKRDE